MGTRSKSLALVLVILFITSLVMVQTALVKASFTTIVVPDDYPTIQEAIDNANSGDTVFVRNGTYYTDAYLDGDGLTIDKSISLIGEDSQKTILKPDWQGRYGPYAGILITADKVEISGFTINGASDNSTFGTDFFDTPAKGYQLVGIRIASNASGSKIADNILLNNAAYQIEDFGDSSVIVGNNITSDNSIRLPYYDGGISLNSSNTLVLNNTISQLGAFGITVRNSQNITIEDNEITGNGVNHNFISEKDIGGLKLANIGSGSVHVYRNNITDNFGSGVDFDQTNNCTLSDNNINGNYNGIYLKNYVLTTSNSRLGTGNTLYDNNLIDNEKTVVIEYAYSYAAGLNNSGVIGNATSQVLWDNGAIGNFWSDLNGNGTYVIDENNIDHHPLTQQVDISSIIPTPTTNQPNAVLILPIAAIVVIIVVIASLLLFKRHQKTADSVNKF